MSTALNAVSSKRESMLVLAGEDVRRLLTVEACISAVENAFRLYGEGTVQAPAVLATHVASGGFHIKAGVLPFEGRLYYAAKVNANFPGNPAKRSLPTIQGVVALFDAECGQPLAAMDSIEITSLRTAAATAVAAKHLARRGSQTVTIIGCGTQSRAQAAALFAVLPITRIFVVDIDPARATAFADEVRQQRPAAEVQVPAELAAGTVQSDVIVTCTTSKRPVLFLEHVRPGTFIAAVGADSEDKQELDPRLLAANMVVPDVVQQAAAIGELHHAIAAGLMHARSTTTDLGRVVAGIDPGRTSDEQITIFDSTGMALQDVAAAATIYTACRNAELPRISLGTRS